MNLRRFSDEDLPGLLALQHAHAGGGARWSAAHLASELHHPARGGGAQVLIAEREGGVAGGAGWVEAGADFFVSPLFAADAAAATALVERLVARATEVGAARVRCSATTADGPKIAALGAAGFEPILDFITLARPAAEVIVPALTHTATAHAVEMVGARPVFADCLPASGNMDVSTIEPLVTPRTKAIGLVHFIGFPCDLGPILALAARRGLKVVEDCAIALGTRYDGTHVGLLGDAGAFSFYPVKHITTGEGGMFVTRHPEVARRVHH